MTLPVFLCAICRKKISCKGTTTLRPQRFSIKLCVSLWQKNFRPLLNDESPENSGLSIFFVRYQTNIFVAINRYKFQFCFLGTWITGSLDFKSTRLIDNFDSLVLVFQDSRFCFSKDSWDLVLRIVGFESILSIILTTQTYKPPDGGTRAQLLYLAIHHLLKIW
jgi:hypothetical protein